jgi:di/tricarboxylate transporter
MKNENIKRFFTLILPLVIIVMFVGLFVGSSISRSNLRKELKEMKENIEKREDYSSRLKEIEEKNKTISFIIGRDEEIEELIEIKRSVP